MKFSIAGNLNCYLTLKVFSDHFFSIYNSTSGKNRFIYYHPLFVVARSDESICFGQEGQMERLC